MANTHDSAALARIAAAREHYRTRASRRPLGMSRSDDTVYDAKTGQRRPANHILVLRQLDNGALAYDGDGEKV